MSRTAGVAGGYLALALVLTWPLARVLPYRIAGDLGDPLFNSWVLLWTGGQLLGALGGNLPALGHYWNANIFHPAPLTLAYSEHLTPQMLQALPVLAATHNAVLAYNLLLLSSIVLSGLGMYLLVRELTGRPAAAFLAGVAFAFAPYRVDQWSHLDVLSSQWMPFALYGFRRFFVTGRLRPLAWGTAALVVQALSCAYYMAYFTPFVVAYCLSEVVARGLVRDRRTWAALAAAGTAALLVVSAFLWPYVEARRLNDVGTREIATVQEFSADTHAFGTISDKAALLGTRVRALPKNEGQGFPGFTILAFAAAGVAAAVAQAVRRARATVARGARWRGAVAWVFGLALLVQAALFVHLLATGIGTVSLAGVVLRMRYRPVRLAIQACVLAAGLLAASPRARRAVRDVHGSPAGFFGWAALVAALLALGPTIFAGGRPLGPGPYDVLYRWVPGFDGLRVPSLHFMLVALFLAGLAGLGAAALTSRRAARVVVAAGVLAVLAEHWSVPVQTSAPPQIVVSGLRAQPAPLYRWIRDLPEGAVIVELPFGGAFTEAGYAFASGYHRKAIVNGYSGFFPASYRAIEQALAAAPENPAAWPALGASGATHVVVHEAQYPDREQGARVAAWLGGHGAREVAAFGGDRVFALP